MVLSEISDDYENVDRIIPPHLTKDCSKLGIAIERSEIVKALGELVGDGLASAYLLSPIELRGMPALDVVEENFETWFYITRRGWISTSPTTAGGPFDDEGEPRPNWDLGECPPRGPSSLR
jgi:hypothetical protein